MYRTVTLASTLLLTVLLSGPVAAQQSPDVQTLQQLRDALTKAIESLAVPPPVTFRIVVKTSAELQAALDTAVDGHTIALMPVEFVGTFYLRNRGLTRFVPIVTEGLTLPEARVTSPAGMAVIRSDTNTPDIQTTPGAAYYRFVGVRFGATRGGEDDMVRCGDSQDPDPAHVPHHIEFDRVWGAGGLNGQRRGIGLNCAHAKVTRSHFENIWKLGQDSQAIAAWSTPGPLFIDDNFLEAASENFIIGGTPPASAAQLPCDITFTNNDLTKRREWQTVFGKVVKNLFELKFGCRVLVAHNRMDGSWPDGQSGFGVLLTVATNVSGLPGCPYCSLTQVVFEDNIVKDVAAGIQILGSAYSSPSGGLDNVIIRRNLIVIDRAKMTGPGGKLGNGWAVQIEAEPNHVTIERNTIVNEGAGQFVNAGLGTTWFSGPASIPARPPTGFVLRANVLFNGSYGFFTPTGVNGRGLGWFTNGAAVVEDNVIIGIPTDPTAVYPVSNRLVPLADKWTVYDPVTYAIRPAFATAGR